MSAAQIERRSSGDFYLSGELTFDSVPHLLETTPFLSPEEGSTCVVDLAGVRRSDSAGLALLVEWARNARMQGVSVTFRRIPEQMLAIARVSNLEEILPLDMDGVSAAVIT